MSYEFRAMPTAEAEWHRNRTEDRFGNTILHYKDGGTYPCRHCLKEAGAQNGALLFSYQVSLPQSAYAQPTAIFLCKDTCTRHESSATAPEIVRNRFVALRAFRADGSMDYEKNALAQGVDAEAEVARILAQEDIAYVNIHTALAGCMLCTVRRV